MDIEIVRKQVAALKATTNTKNPQHAWKFNFAKDGGEGTAAVRLDQHPDGARFAACCINDKASMVFQADAFVTALTDALASAMTYQAPGAVQDVTKGLWAKVNLRDGKVWFNTTSRGRKVNCFTVPIDEIEAVMVLMAQG